MDSNVDKILACLNRRENFISFVDVGENSVYVRTPLTDANDHATYLNFEISDDVLRVEIKHFFGLLYGEYEPSDTELLQFLRENAATFASSSAYLAIEEVKGDLFLSLQTYRTFFLKWPPDEIAEHISLAFFDIKGAFLLLAGGVRTWPPGINFFQKRE